MNPVLGETFSGMFRDGTLLFSEQISHHPNIGYSYVVGPKEEYKYWCYVNSQGNLSFSSLEVQNKGKKHLRFRDGQLITSDYPKVSLSSNAYLF